MKSEIALSFGAHKNHLLEMFASTAHTSTVLPLQHTCGQYCADDLGGPIRQAQNTFNCMEMMHSFDAKGDLQGST